MNNSSVRVSVDDHMYINSTDIVTPIEHASSASVHYKSPARHATMLKCACAKSYEREHIHDLVICTLIITDSCVSIMYDLRLL